MSHSPTRDRASTRTAAGCGLSAVQRRNRPGCCGRGRRDRCRSAAGPLPAWPAMERTYRPAEVVGPPSSKTSVHAVHGDRAALTGRGLPSPWLCIRAFWSCACTRPSMASMAAAAMIRVSRVMRLDLFRLLDMGAHVLSRIAAASRCRHSRARACGLQPGRTAPPFFRHMAPEKMWGRAHAHILAAGLRPWRV